MNALKQEKNGGLRRQGPALQREQKLVDLPGSGVGSGAAQ